MISSHAKLLEQVHEYVDEYIAYLGDHASAVTPQVNDDLRGVIHDLEVLQTHPDQPQRVERVAEGICDQLERLRQLHNPTRSRQTLSRPKRTLAQAFQEYIEQEVNYLAQVGGSTRREQVNLLLGDIITDLNALALHPTDEQAELLAADLEKKRRQLEKLERPWQQMQRP